MFRREPANRSVSRAVLDPGTPFPLVSKQGDELVLRFTPSMRGYVSMNGQRRGLDELVGSGVASMSAGAYAMALPRGAKAKIVHGGVVFDVAAVAAAKPVVRSHPLDKPFWSYTTASGVVLGSLLALVHLVPEDALSMSMDELAAENRYVGFQYQPQEQPEQEVAAAAVHETNTEPAHSQAHARPRASASKLVASKAPAGRKAITGPQHAIPMPARGFDAELAARTAGILGPLAQASGHTLASPFGGAYAVGNADENVWGGPTGDVLAQVAGVGGLDLATVVRGGGNAEGTIGLADVGLIGNTKDGYGPTRKGTIAWETRGPRAPQVRPGKPTGSDQIDKEAIRRIVRSRHNEVRHCYNQALTRDPNLQGRLEVTFTIGPTGTVPVAAISANTLGDREIGSCVAAAVRRWRFPRPATGGTAMVTYPFSFSPG